MDINNIINYNLENNDTITGLSDSFFALLLRKNIDKNIIVVVSSLYEANNVFSQINEVVDNSYLFPMDDFLTSEAVAVSPDLVIKRLEVLDKLLDNSKKVIVCNLMGFLRFLPDKKLFSNSIINIKVGDLINRDEFINNLNKLGYIRDSLVNKTGEFAVRGFIIDIFPIDYNNPIRIEFFDDEVESLRIFNLDNQLSYEKIDSFKIKPITEFIVDEYDNIYEKKQKYLSKYSITNSLCDYLDDSFVIYKDYNQIINAYNILIDEISEFRKEKDSSFKDDYMYKLENINIVNRVYYNSLDNYGSNTVNFKLLSINSFREDIFAIKNFLSHNFDKTIVICLKKYQINNLLKLLNMNKSITTFDNIKKNEINFVECNIDGGFIYNDLVIITSREIYNTSNIERKYNSKFNYSKSINDINKIKLGDYVVHKDHGIGIYDGIKSLQVMNVLKDYIVVLYKGDDKLYIPVDKVGVLSKYSPKEGVIPKICGLDGIEWNKTKNRVKNKVNIIADKLLKIYAERESKKGFAFSKDNDLMIDFEQEFEYELTKDQIKAIANIKKEMESEKPMDMLLCGDVGFGKTEVAFVAAFKAIMDSKQVLLLCPTTILATQHYNNALKRFKNFPVDIGCLTRFTSSSECIRIIEGLKNGTIDFVIGTHRLLSNDILVKNLGLLIVDEEQRFGVMHKEKLKSFKTNIDVLTLSATPIPRTLQMSLVGIRSLSLIETPPSNRFPVQTYVLEESDQIIRDAICKELSRSGQVFILYNRIDEIDLIKDRIKALVENAKITIIHGQMNKNILEKRLMDFTNKVYDILICTTIIETGMDISNVNTLIVIDADKFGLSQLYQLRGRVGRSDKFAYAYLMYKKNKFLSDIAIKRLNAIKEFTELGSGFNIANRDLSIRGAGDILGSEQAGFIDSVGIDLYLKMLDDEIKNRTDNNDDSSDEVGNKNLLINVDTHIDDNYVMEDDIKIEIHKKIALIDSKEKYISIKNEIIDRFGPISDKLDIYMYEILLEKIVEKLNIIIKEYNKYIEIRMPNDFINIDDLFIKSYEISKNFRFINKHNVVIIYLDKNNLDKHVVYYLVDLLELVRKG